MLLLLLLLLLLLFYNILWRHLTVIWMSIRVQKTENCMRFDFFTSNLNRQASERVSEWASVCVAWRLTLASCVCTLIDNGREPIRNKDTDVLYKLTFSVEEPTRVCLVLSPQFIKPSLEDAQAITGFPWGDTSYHRTPADKEIHYQEQ